MKHGTIASLLIGAALSLAAPAFVAMAPRPALALSLEAAPTNPDGSAKFVDPDQKFERFNNDNNLSNDRDRDRSDNPPGLSFGSQDSGMFTFTVRRPDADPFNNSRFFGPDTAPSRR